MESTSCRTLAARAALGAFPWRALTPQMLVRRVLAVDDWVGVGSPVARDDPRVDPVVAALAGVAWRTWTLDAVCWLLLDALDEWQARDHCLDVELAWLLAEGA